MIGQPAKEFQSSRCPTALRSEEILPTSDVVVRNALPPRENPYGFLKRIRFFEDVIEQRKPKTILDIGCGVGSLITFPLAERFPEVRFSASDEDAHSIRIARERNDLANLDFLCESELHENTNRFDLIIASEVLEHVANPIEFLRSLRQKLTDDGVVILTVPNGYGPFEWTSLCYVLADLSGVYGLVSRLKRGRNDVVAGASQTRDTLANSPHVNFFSYQDLLETFRKSGLSVARYRPRTFLCGWLVDKLVGNGRGATWNAQIADYLPASVCSGWMFVLSKGDSQACQHRKYTRTHWARMRKRLNEVAYHV